MEGLLGLQVSIVKNIFLSNNVYILNDELGSLYELLIMPNKNMQIMYTMDVIEIFFEHGCIVNDINFEEMVAECGYMENCAHQFMYSFEGP